MNKDVTGKHNYITSLQNRIRNQRTEITRLRAENKNLKTIIKSSSISKTKPKNNPLTLDEVKALKKGDVVWIKTESKVCEIEIDAIKPPNSNSVWHFISYMRLTCFSLSELNINYFLYRSKPEGKEEQE